jgi:hypothetical protein
MNRSFVSIGLLWAITTIRTNIIIVLTPILYALVMKNMLTN